MEGVWTAMLEHPARPAEFDDIVRHVHALRREDEVNRTTSCRDMLAQLVWYTLHAANEQERLLLENFSISATIWSTTIKRWVRWPWLHMYVKNAAYSMKFLEILVDKFQRPVWEDIHDMCERRREALVLGWVDG